MQRTTSFALLMIAILVAAPMQAQRAGGAFHGGGAPMPGGNRPGFGSRPGFPNGYVPRHPGYSRFRNYGSGYAYGYYPYWDEEPFESYPEPEPTENVASPPVLVFESRDCRPPAPVPEPPKLIEVPQTKEADATSKPEPPTLFVFANGERLEARRYMLTADSLQVETGRQQRTISIGKLDLDATIAANRERGIDLQIPTDSNHIFLGF
jgi:hypothetical protein